MLLGKMYTHMQKNGITNRSPLVQLIKIIGIKIRLETIKLL